MPAETYHDQLAPYLLGTLPEPLRQQIDDRLLTDEPLFESLRATENELVYDYALSLLGPEERAQFEARFPANTAIRQKVANARDLLHRMRGIGGRTGTRSSSRWMLWVPLATAAVAVLVVGWLVSENTRLRDRLAFSNRLARAAVERASESERVAQEAEQRADTAGQTAPAGSAATAANPLVLSMVLQPGVVRSDARARRIRLAPGTAALRLQLDLPPNARPYGSYRIFVRTPDDVEVWSGAISDREAGHVIASVPASALKPNDYEIVVSGQTPSGSLEEVASYNFSVLR